MSPGVGEHHARTADRAVHQRGRDVTRQTVQHAGLDHRLGEEEHVGRTRPREPGDGVERRLRDLDHRADRAEQPAGALDVRVGRVGAAGDRGDALADERRRVRHGPHHRASRDRGLDRRDRDPGRDRDHEGVGVEGARRGVEHRGDVGRLDRDHDDVGLAHHPGCARRGADPGEQRLQLVAAGRRRPRRPRATRRRARRRAGRRRARRPCGRLPSTAMRSMRRRLLVRWPPAGALRTREGPGSRGRLRTSPNGATGGPRASHADHPSAAGPGTIATNGTERNPTQPDDPGGYELEGQR